jgi:hypothetical protein
VVIQQIQREPKIGRSQERWFHNFRQLVSFQVKTGRLPRESGRDGTLLVGEAGMASWMRYQRRRAQRGIMPPWQQVLLEQLPGFSWDPAAELWEGQYSRLRAFLEAERRVPRYRSVEPGERELAAWVSKQRHLHRRHTLDPQRVELLRRLPFRIV